MNTPLARLVGLVSLPMALALVCTACSSTTSPLSADAEPPAIDARAIPASERRVVNDAVVRSSAPIDIAAPDADAAAPMTFAGDSPEVRSGGAAPPAVPYAMPFENDYADVQAHGDHPAPLHVAQPSSPVVSTGPITRALRSPRRVSGARAKKTSEYRGAYVETTPQSARRVPSAKANAVKSHAKPVAPLGSAFDFGSSDCADGSCAIPSPLGR